jgi:flagellin
VGSAINTIAEQRAKVGAYEAQFQFADADIASSNQATTAAASVILDCDAAAEKSRLSADMVKTQAAVAALSQASQLPRALLKLINT